MFLECGHCGDLIYPSTCSKGDPAWCPKCGRKFNPVVSGSVPRRSRTAAAPAEAVVPVEVVRPAPAAPLQEAITATPKPPAPPVIARRAPVRLPAEMPLEIQALGEPEAVLPPDEKNITFNRNLVHFLAGCSAALLLALAAFLFFAYLQPFGKNRPPAVVFLGMGTGAAFLALLTVAAGYWSTHSAWVLSHWGPRTYLVYPEVLAEVFPDRHRLIAWEKIGACQTSKMVVAWYRFQVEGEKALAFDNTVSDHERFSKLLSERAARRRFVLSFGDESALSELRRARLGPSIVVHALGLVAHVYRITVLGDRLLFYKAVHGGGLSPTPPPNAGGLVGAIAVTAHTRLRHKFLEEIRALEAADAAALLDRAAVSEGSFVVSAADLQELRLDPPSGTQELLFGVRGAARAGLLKLNHGRQGEMTLAVLSREDVVTILEQWPRLFGQVLQVNLEWNPSTGQFVARR